MIHRCRPDIELGWLCRTLADGLSAPDRRLRLAPIADRPLLLTPTARDGMAWFLRQAGIRAGDEVAVPALVCQAVAEAVLAVGARPLAFGARDSDFGPSLELCEQAVSPRMKAVVVPHLYGVPADLRGFRTLCDARGMLLIEDCAPCLSGEADGVAVGAGGDCSVFSFKYDKPLSLGWGGALSLAEEMSKRLPPVDCPAMSEADDRCLAASLLVQHCLTDAARLGPAFLPMDHGLEHLMDHTGHVDEVCELAVAQDGAQRMAAWCKANVAAPQPPRHGGLRSVAKRVVPGFLRRLLKPAAGPSAAARRFEGNSLRPGGLCEHLLAAQQARLADAGPARAAIAEVYQQTLDRDRLLVPSPARPPSHWLRFPVSLRAGPRARNALETRARHDAGVEIGPCNWPLPLHRVPHLRGVVREGPGCARVEQLVAGLLNLPVHAQVPPDAARRLAELINTD